MMLVLEAVVAQLLLPIFLLWWMQSASTWFEACVRFIVCAMSIWIIGHVTSWLILPITSSSFYIKLAVVLLVIKIFRAKMLPEKWQNLSQRFVPLSAVLVILLIAVIYLQGARQVNEDSVVTLAYPFASGKFYVMNGGTLSLLNSHQRIASGDERYEQLKGQRHGVDFMVADQYGLVSSGILPNDPDAYLIFGKEVLAPCDGVVRKTENSRQDTERGQQGVVESEGNYLVLECEEGFEVVLAHLQLGSPTLRIGQNVAAGQVVAKAGSTGNAEFPYLHIHAQRPAQGTAISSGEPLQIRFKGRYLIKGDIVNSEAG